MKAAGILALGSLTAVACHPHHIAERQNAADTPLAEGNTTLNGIPFATRAYWMRRANQALAELANPCPFAAFATAIVNHTAPGLGELVCIGINSNGRTGNPSLHGEIEAIANCTAVLTDPNGRYKLNATQALAAWPKLSLYTNAESCPMCASAIRWSGFREYIYGTTIDNLIETGWGQIRIESSEVFEQSYDLPTSSRLLGGVLTNETDPLFAWQFQADQPCPSGCGRANGTCVPT